MKSNTVKEEISKLDKFVKWVLIGGVVILILMPVAATQLDWFFDYTNTGQIGDTIGGLTAPVIGVVSALLIYFSFRAQINANRIIQDQIDEQKNEEASKRNFDHQMERYRHLERYIDDFSYTYTKRSQMGFDTHSKEITLKGGEAIIRFFRDELALSKKGVSIDENSKHISQLKAIITFFNLVMNNLEPSAKDRNSEFIFTLIEIKFYRNIWDYIHEMIANSIDNPEQYNAIFRNLLGKINSIEIELDTYKGIWSN